MRYLFDQDGTDFYVYAEADPQTLICVISYTKRVVNSLAEAESAALWFFAQMSAWKLDVTRAMR